MTPDYNPNTADELLHSGSKAIAVLILAVVFAMAFMVDAKAADYSLVVHGLSRHATTHDPDTGKRWREVNPGLGLRIGLSDELSAQAGAYRNSQNRNSAYLIADYLPIEISGVRFGGALGLATGYRVSPVMPVAAFVARWQTDAAVSITLRFVPPKVPKVTSVVAIEIGIRL